MIVAIRSVLVRLPIRSVWIALVGRDYAVRDGNAQLPKLRRL
ncbi:hypothetical protein [Oscillatoria sp. HE19RPO]|nr:hypothetical protein [Oscillatoria sp. HE19RPO]